MPRAVPRPACDDRSSSPATCSDSPAPTRPSSTRQRRTRSSTSWTSQRDVDRQGRHDAPRRVHRRAGAGLAGGRGLRRRRSCPSATATATSSTRTTAAGSMPPASAARASRPTAGWSSSSSSRPPVLGRHPGPSRVQEPAQPAGPVVPRVHRRGARPGRGPQAALFEVDRRGRWRSDRCFGSRLLPATADPTGGRIPPSGRHRDRTAASRHGGAGHVRGAGWRRPSSATSSATSGSSAMVPLLDDGRSALLVRQYRGPIDAELLEIPAGLCDMEGEDDPARHRARELAEEVGKRAGSARPAGQGPPHAGPQRRVRARSTWRPAVRRRPRAAGRRGGAHDAPRSWRWPTSRR